MRLQNKNSWYTILVTLMIIGFLIVITTWVLNLVLREMNDNRGEAKYLQAYAGAEWAMEIALLKIKNIWYWVYDKVDNSTILETPKEKIKISYDLQSKTNSFSWSLEPFEQAVIPLFYLGLDWIEQKVKNIKLNISWTTDIGWNIVSEGWDWIWWSSHISNNTKWDWRKSDWSYLWEINVNWNSWFLNTYFKNYLIIVNLDSINNLEYNLSSSDWEFTKPVSKIISSAEILGYKQNLETTLDNTAFLSILKYSIYSNSTP